MDREFRSEHDSDESEGISVIDAGGNVDEGVRPGRSVFAENDLDDDLTIVDDELPHWTAPPSGSTASVNADSWSTITGAQPRWRDTEAEVEDEVFSFAAEDDQPGHDFFGYQDDDDVFVELDEDLLDAPVVVPLDSRRGPARAADAENRGRLSIGARAGHTRDDMLVRVATGVALAAAALVIFKIGPRAAVVLVAVLLALAVAEFFAATRRAGYQPAALLGIAATAAMPLAIYWRGIDAIPLMLFLTVAFSMVWFLIGVGNESPLLNVGVTVLGVLYVGMLGSFAALMLSRWGDNGVGILLGGVIAAVAYDVGGLFIGRAIGRSPLSAVSPNKTVEGLVGGMALCIIVSTVVVPLWEPWGTWKHGFVLGIGAAIAAPIGDLCESLLKRDLGVKDMGSLLPGHGGLLDRFDAMLFVLPVTYEVARLLDLV